VTDRDEIERLVDRGDLDALLRAVGQSAESDDWDGVMMLREACRGARHTGRQLWPAATLAEYRLALDGPGPYAASMLVEDAGHFAVGPLAEVAAARHSWADLAPHLDGGPRSALFAHERVLRGEDLRDAPVAPDVLDLPLVIVEWEPDYPLAEYSAERAHFPSPAPVATSSIALPTASVDASSDDVVDAAFRELVAPWTRESNGRVEVVSVEGDERDALAALGITRVRVAEVDARCALATLAWAGASGGAHGRRRGMAIGRFSAWWLVAALGGIADDEPLPADELGEVAHSLHWFVWDAEEPVLGWQIRLAVHDEDSGCAWAFSATDEV
jgi:Family of unknown function (DUF6183)